MSAPEGTSARGPVIGINFGNAYASIAVVNKEGHADCIANEDGERQIACAISYSGEEVYIGNGALPQLVKNAKNTVAGFRNLLGKKFSEVDAKSINASTTSAPIIDINGEIGYSVQVLLPPPSAPTPSTKASAAASARSTPAPTRPPSPPAPISVTKQFTVAQITSLFLSSLKTSAEDFLGKPIAGAVLNVSDTWSPTQKEALEQAAEDAGITVLQLAPEEALAVLGAHDSSVGKSLLGLESTASIHNASDPSAQLAKTVDAAQDRTSLVLDLGSSSLTLNLLSINESLLVHSLLPNGTPHHAPNSQLGGDAIDSLLIGHFLKEFTKKTKIAVTFPPTTPEDQRAVAKLKLAVDHTKKSLQASSGAASCSVESLKDGFDFSGTINRIRFDVLCAPIYSKIISEISSVLKEASIPKERVDEVLLVGGSSGLSGLTTKLEEYFVVGERTGAKDVAIRSDLDGAQVLSKGAALQASLLESLGAPDSMHETKDGELHSAFVESGHPVLKTHVTSKPVGLVFPVVKGAHEEVDVVLVPSDAPLPARRTIRFPVAKGATKIGFEIWEGEHGIKELERLPKLANDDDDDEEEDEDEEEPPQFEAVVKKGTLLGGLALDLVAVPPPTGKKVAERVYVEVRGDVAVGGHLEVSARQVGASEGEHTWVKWNAK